MKIYFAAAEVGNHYSVLKQAHAAAFGCLPRILMSYYGLRKREKDLDVFVSDDILLDSGAFSAWTRNARIDIEEYVEFIKRHGRRFTIYANLDVIGDFAASMRNQRRMEALGVSPVPVFHMSAPQESYASLDALCAEYDYIALGGLAGKNFSAPQKIAHLDKCWQLIGAHFRRGHQVKVHGFGVTQMAFLERYPFYSVDSTTWINGEKYGEVQQFARGAIVKTRSAKVESKRASRSLGSHLVFATYHEKDHMAAVAWRKYESYVTQLWAKRGITWT